ncbi:MAG: response regulator [Clostridiales bacterium]|jgi:CheY-like chemotaxis protein|nr:response regulator [Eubacteriales bacterium]MDH7565200.1 response regulator [Clostridiales bacterium]
MKRVLLVNDSMFQSIIMKDSLSEMGFKVEVTDEYDAIELTKSFKPDIVVVNYIMKEIRGDQLISLIKLEHPEIKCILSSSSAIDRRNTLTQKIDEFLHIPAETDELTHMFNKYLDE